jgi:hypothetical protein
MIVRYYIQRYCHGIWRIRQWLPLVFLPSVVYLLVVSAVPDRFTVIQKVAVQSIAPIALSRSPVDTLPMAEITSRPAELFLDDFAILDLINISQAVPGMKKETASRNLRGVIENSMMLKPADDASVLLSYYGRDVELGKILVKFYTQRLVSRSKDGLVRSTSSLNRAGAPETNGGSTQLQTERLIGGESAISQPQQATPDGEMRIQEHRTFWRHDRLLPLLGILTGALMLWFILAGFVELADPAFKSERQISRYLDLPVIGVMPDLDPLIQRLQPKK